MFKKVQIKSQQKIHNLILDLAVVFWDSNFMKPSRSTFISYLLLVSNLNIYFFFFLGLSVTTWLGFFIVDFRLPVLLTEVFREFGALVLGVGTFSPVNNSLRS